MATDADYRRDRHVISALHAHLVFVTEHRRGAQTGEMIRFLVPAFGKVCQGFGAARAACHGEDDHVHLLVEYLPKVPASALNSLKGVSACDSASGTVCVPTASTCSPLPTSPHAEAARRYRSPRQYQGQQHTPAG